MPNKEKKMNVPSFQVQAFQKEIFSWWEKNARDLPWRKTNDPYRILLSEIMLQQTQVSRVLPIYQTFLARFPDIHALHRAPLADILRSWKGMGYNRRAVYLKKIAEKIVSHYGEFPQEENELQKLPGIGKYTARAVAIFAFKKQLAAIDTNIRRIITDRFFHGIEQTPSRIQSVAEQLLPKSKAWEWHQALMDYAAATVQKKKTKEKKKRQQAIPFRQSKRFYRGRIIDILREKTVQHQKLLEQMTKTYEKPEYFFQTLLDDLLSEGLISMTKRCMLKLPE